jgi:hypothetical protein
VIRFEFFLNGKESILHIGCNGYRGDLGVGCAKKQGARKS